MLKRAQWEMVGLVMGAAAVVGAAAAWGMSWLLR